MIYCFKTRKKNLSFTVSRQTGYMWVGIFISIIDIDSIDRLKSLNEDTTVYIYTDQHIERSHYAQVIAYFVDD